MSGAPEKRLLKELRGKLKAQSRDDKACRLAKFFKTGPGEYAEKDIFLGIGVPEIRRTIRDYCHLGRGSLKKILSSQIHEERSAALLILVSRYRQGDESQKRSIYEFYMDNTRFVNNWDLVDLSAHHIIGDFLLCRPKGPIYRLAKSKAMWDRRIAVVSTYRFIKEGRFDHTLKISRILINDGQDLIHKACGWMLREVGKKENHILENFLEENADIMPRVMLRYAIEKFNRKKRDYFLNLNKIPVA